MILRVEGGLPPMYATGDDNYFTLNIHYGGNFTATGAYEGGNVCRYDFCSSSTFSFVELNDIIGGFGLTGGMKCYYRDPILGLKDPQFEVGMIFRDAKEFRAAVREYAIKNGKNIKFVKNEKTRVRGICKPSCPWVIYASLRGPADDTFQIKTFKNKHNCGREFRNRNVKSTWLPKRYVDKMITNPDWPIDSFKAQVVEDYMCGVSKDQLYRAKRKSKVLIEGSYDDQYNKLWDYCEELRKSDPCTTAKMKVELSDDQQTSKFLRIYICLRALKSGFGAGCRTIIGIDGCHLRGPHTGQLLTAVGIDGDNSTFPIAYAVVEIENMETWVWFLELLIDDVGIENNSKWTLISDQQKKCLPDVENRFCVRHLHSNFRDIGGFKGKVLKDLLWNAARATTLFHFEHPYPKCDMLLNNLCESFNATLVESRGKPILSMLESIRCYLMDRMLIRKEKWRSLKVSFVLKFIRYLRITNWPQGVVFQNFVGITSFRYFVKEEISMCVI